MGGGDKGVGFAWRRAKACDDDVMMMSCILQLSQSSLTSAS